MREKWWKNLNAVQQDGRHIRFCFRVENLYQAMHLDAKLLEHTLSNLISNAFKYSAGKENPELRIHYKPTEVVISDKRLRGMGFLKGSEKHLFEPFFRAENVSEIQGTGLGLSIAKEYVEVNKGNIVVKSTLGKGSTFEITFPKERI